MTDAGFVIAAYGVVLVTLATYVATVWRRIGRARAASLRIRRDAEPTAVPAAPDDAIAGNASSHPRQ